MKNKESRELTPHLESNIDYSLKNIKYIIQEKTTI